MPIAGQPCRMNRDEGPASSPRTGIRGGWDRLVGPDSTRTEDAMVLGFAVLFAGGVLSFALANDLGWTPIQLGIVGLVALDLGGGVVAYTTRPGSRWWHRPGRDRWDRFRLVAVYLSPFVVAAVIPGFGWVDAAIAYGYLLASAGIVLAAPERIRRPLAMAAYAVGLLIALYVVTPPRGLEWFVPLLYLKLVIGHLVPTK